MGQQPNIEVDLTERPRTKPGPAPARPWKPNRPADLGAPSEVPSGGPFGVIGPDAGYALKLVGEHELELLPGEHHHDAAVAVAAIATARAARLGRAPIADDISVGLIVLGFDAGAAVDEAIASARPGWIANVGHNAAKLREIVADIPGDVLPLAPSDLRARIAAGWAYREATE